MSIDYKDLGELKRGSYVIIDGEPCKVIEITKSPVDSRVEVPIIKKGRAQVVAVTDSIHFLKRRSLGRRWSLV